MQTPMERVFTYPSAELPPVPSFELACPEGWEPGEAPDCLAVVRGAPGARFTVNLTVGYDRVAASVDLETAARITLAQAEADFADYQVEEERVVEVDGRPASLRFQSFASPDGQGRLVQLQLLVFGPRASRQTADLFHLNGTWPAEEAEHGEVIVAIAQSFRFLDGDLP